MRETQALVVFLVGDSAYQLKKLLVLSFLDSGSQRAVGACAARRCGSIGAFRPTSTASAIASRPVGVPSTPMRMLQTCDLLGWPGALRSYGQVIRGVRGDP